MEINFDKYVYRYLVTLVIITLGLGTIAYHYVEKLSWVDAYYFCVVTLATVGYGDITPKTSFGKLLTTFYILIGVGIITTFITYTLRRRTREFERRSKKNNSRD